MAEPTKMTDCPRFDHCSAPLCPLGAWRRSRHLPGERVCLWLTEHAKAGGSDRLVRHAGTDIAEIVSREAEAITGQWSAVAKAVRVAAKTGSKLEAGERLRA